MKKMLVMGLIFAVSAAQAQKYGFTFFRDNGQDGVYLAVSDDGLAWREANGGKTIMKPPFGDKLTRDPSVCVGPDKKYHMAWTCGWECKGFGVAHSADLRTWTGQQFVPVCTDNPAARNTWAPEIFYDDASVQYMVIWATTITNQFLETAGLGDGYCNHRIYCTTTKDFVTWSPRKLFYDGGFNVIDAFPFKMNGRYGMIVKNETLKPAPEKNLHVVWSSGGAQGPWGKAEAAFTDNRQAWAEGPTLLRTEKGWLVYFDEYNKGRYGTLLTQDFKSFTPVKSELPKDIRHGTTFALLPGAAIR